MGRYQNFKAKERNQRNIKQTMHWATATSPLELVLFTNVSLEFTLTKSANLANQ